MDYRIKRLTYSAAALAAALLLPLLTGGDMKLGNMLCLMHIPVLICGFICGPIWGGAVGLAAPLLRGLIFGKPPFMPTGICMAFELCAYAVFAGVLYKALPKKAPYTYLSLASAMVLGRFVWGIAQYIVLNAQGKGFTLSVFWTNAFATALPGIALQLVLIPLVIIALEKANLIPAKPTKKPA